MSDQYSEPGWTDADRMRAALSRKADIFETWDDERDAVGYYIVYDDENITASVGGLRVRDSAWKPARIYRRRCDAGRVARKRAEKVSQWYTI